MKQFYFLNNSGELKASIKLKGNFVVAYSLRLWKTDDKVLELVEDIRGSCFNSNCKEVCYTLAKIKDEGCNYYLELDSNISTVHPSTNYSIKLKLEQMTANGQLQFLGKESISGVVGFNDGGKYSKLGLSLNPNAISKMAV